MKKSTFYFFSKSFVIASLTIAVAGCGSDSHPSDDAANPPHDSAAATEKTDNVAVVKKTVFHTIPSPVETASLLKQAGAKYGKELLNPTENVSHYSNTKSRALNLGVYGMDLVFTTLYDQTQETEKYFAAANKLATQLGINGAFSEDIYQRIKNNRNNQDSLMALINEATSTTESYLRDNQRENASELIYAGGWIEGLYIATRIAAKSKNDEVVKRVADQSISLKGLLAQMNDHAKDEDVAPVIASLTEIKAIFDKFETSQTATEVKTDDKGVATIGNNAKTTVTPENLKELTAKIEQIRAEIIK